MNFTSETEIVSINIGDEIANMRSEYKEPGYEFKASLDGVYKIEYTKDAVDSISVRKKPKHFFSHGKIVKKTKELINKKWTDLVYLEKDETYLIDVNLKPNFNKNSYTIKVSTHEVPANDNKSTAKEIDLTSKIEGNLDYATDTDWYKFSILKDANMKVIYSREISDAIKFYEEDKVKKSEGAKVYLTNNTVEETFKFEEGKNYYISVKHVKFRSLDKYMIKFSNQKFETIWNDNESKR